MKNVIEKAKALLDAIDKNGEELWSVCLEHTHECIIWSNDDIVNDYESLDDTTEFSGIMNEYNALKKAIEEEA